MKLNKRIVTVMTTVLALFLILVIYLTYFTLFVAPELQVSTYNPRIWEKEESVLRGEIYDRNGEILAYSEKTDTGQTRIYPYGDLYAHTIGYNCRVYGKSNIELQFNDHLLATKTTFKIKKETEDGEEKLENGANLYLTLDHSMTELAKNALGSSRGSVIAINPKTGEVYCLYSNPSFDPNEDALSENWETLQNRDDYPLVARATKGLYAPGSTFKIITASAAIEAGHGNFTMNDTGKTSVDGRPFKNYGGYSYGTMDMKKAITKSSNVYFAEISQLVGKDNLGNMAEKLYITKKVSFDIDVDARNAGFKDFNNVALAEASIGQGTLQVTPFNMAIAACAIANDGVIMKPYMAIKSVYDNGEIEKRFGVGEVLARGVIGDGTARTIRDYMKSCVDEGTGKGARVSGLTVAGKTGTAENERKGKEHAWFVGMAPAENPQIVVCVMKEYSGDTGGTVCAPIAAKIINYALKNGLITK